MKHFRSLLTLSLAFILVGFTASKSESFHFTVTADCRDEKATLASVLDAIEANVGEPEFHISAGDIDRTVQGTRDEFSLQFGNDFIWIGVVCKGILLYLLQIARRTQRRKMSNLYKKELCGLCALSG